MTSNIKQKPPIKNFEKMLLKSTGNSILDTSTSQKEEIKLIFNLLNANDNYFYKLNVKNPDKNIKDDSSYTEFKQCSNSNSIFFLEYNCEYSFGKDQKLEIEISVKGSKQTNTYTLYTTIGEIIGSRDSTKCFNINNSQNGEMLEVMQDISKVVGIKKLENSEEGSADLDFTVILGPKYVAE